ncbi:MAG: Rrf2 family transcriptional regulator [Gemmatimonadetes bacterium]|nr:Rrf2 family transcriptional regulator [Gemmatimonadota bacterium]MCK5482111.1 Rrf2 family transcriptional regulator [Gemmatimonadota bacterium]
MVSRTEEYALRAAVCLARRYGTGTVRARDMAKATGIPANYLSKILHQLAKAGVVASERGRSGGFTLAAPPSTVVLASVVAPFEPQVQRTRCLLGLPECSDSNPCGAHERWRTIKEATLEFLNHTTLADVIDDGDAEAANC